ncbi:MAG TPA: hypothetical protein VIW93_13105 [Candidatus Acidoferrum sp.]
MHFVCYSFSGKLYQPVRGQQSPVVWSIECTSNLWAGIERTNKNEAAFLIKIASIRWISGEEAEVKGGAA